MTNFKKVIKAHNHLLSSLYYNPTLSTCNILHIDLPSDPYHRLPSSLTCKETELPEKLWDYRVLSQLSAYVIFELLRNFFTIYPDLAWYLTLIDDVLNFRVKHVFGFPQLDLKLMEI